MLLSYGQGLPQPLCCGRCPPLLFGMSIFLPRPRDPCRIWKGAERKLRVDSSQVLICLELKTLGSRMSFLSFAEFLVQESPPPETDPCHYHNISNNFPHLNDAHWQNVPSWLYNTDPVWAHRNGQQHGLAETPSSKEDWRNNINLVIAILEQTTGGADPHPLPGAASGSRGCTGKHRARPWTVMNHPAQKEVF